MNTKRLYHTFFLFLMGMLSAHPQGVTFSSPQVEYGIREHLGIDATEEVTKEQLDTISCINLSGLGITDIHDIILLSNARQIYLQCNEIRDISPLILLDSLSYVDLSKNLLESINVLAFSHSPRMTVDVAFNHITDFSCFQSLTSCCFTISGSSLQTEADALYFRTCYLYGDGTEEKAQVRCRVLSNVEEEARVEIANELTSVPKDGTDVIVESNQNETHKVLLAWGDNVADSTYLVPCTVLLLKASESVTIKTGLPEHFILKDITPTTHGSVRISGTDIEYTANSEFETEDLMFSYYEDDIFKGISRIVLGSDASGIKEVTEENGRLLISMNGLQQLHVYCSSHGLSDKAGINIYDTGGRKLVTKQVYGRNGIDTDIPISSIRGTVLIVQVTSGRKKFVERIILE